MTTVFPPIVDALLALAGGFIWGFWLAVAIITTGRKAVHR